jgi:hypothetical protein
MMQEATVVKACEAAGKAPKQEQAPRDKIKKGNFNVLHIVKEVKSTGKATIYFLVEWEG